MREYVGLTVLVFILVLFAALFVTDRIACAMDDMANTVANARIHDNG